VQKRGGSRVVSLSGLEGRGLELGAGQSPLEQALLNEEYRHYVYGLAEGLRDFSELRLAGCTHKEIGAQLGCVERTVERKLALIFKKWQGMAVESLSQDLSGPAGGGG
jgi:hypothetical protein